MARRVAILTNFLPYYRIPLYEALMPLLGDLRVFLSTRMERDRHWTVFWGKLDVVVQRSLTWTHNFRNVHGYRDSSQIHIPYDTFFQLRTYRPDAIISGEFGLRTFMSVLYGMAFPKTVLIVWATLSDRTEATRGRFRVMLRRWIVRRVDAVFVNGKSGARYLASLGFTGPIITIPQVIDDTAFLGESTIAKDEALCLLYVGQLIERKGLHLFLLVMRQWCVDHPDRSILLRIAGDGPERARLESVSLPPNLKIELLGDIVPNMLPAYYHSASILAFPTLGDEWGLVVNEALIAGVPVLGSVYSQAVEDLVREGENGWVFRPTDTRDTYNALDRALTADRETLGAMSLNARASIAELTPAAIAAKMANAIQALLQK